MPRRRDALPPPPGDAACPAPAVVERRRDLAERRAARLAARGAGAVPARHRP
jgi:hypothetical protein